MGSNATKDTKYYCSAVARECRICRTPIPVNSKIKLKNRNFYHYCRKDGTECRLSKSGTATKFVKSEVVRDEKLEKRLSDRLDKRL